MKVGGQESEQNRKKGKFDVERSLRGRGNDHKGKGQGSNPGDSKGNV